MYKSFTFTDWGVLKVTTSHLKLERILTSCYFKESIKCVPRLYLSGTGIVALPAYPDINYTLRGNLIKLFRFICRPSFGNEREMCIVIYALAHLSPTPIKLILFRRDLEHGKCDSGTGGRMAP